jgi:Zn-dependent peptidase ImmA (M78 family)
MTNLRRAAEEAAITVLEQTWDINKLPVNPVEIAEKLGLRVFEAQLPGNVSGVLKRVPPSPAEIYLDIDDNVRRRRFTCAHEIGHYQRRKVGSGETLAYIDRRDGVSSEGEDQEEIFANSFAAALLMPLTVLSNLRDVGFSTLEMSRYLIVSEQSLKFRFDNLRRDGIIS